MLRQTAPLSKMASTRGGMRRILKKGITAEKFLDMACKAGTYKSPSSKGPGALTNRDLPREFDGQQQGGGRQFLTRWQREEQMKRRRGVVDYPIEYEILKMNPPLPPPPKTPVKLRKRLAAERFRVEQAKKKEAARRKALGLDDLEAASAAEEENKLPGVRHLVQSFLNRRDVALRAAYASGPSANRDEDEAYSRLLLGMSTDEAKGRSDAARTSPASLRSAMGRKSAAVENAYAFALRQQEVMLNGGDGAILSERESADEVERILREEARADRRGGRRTAEGVVRWREVQAGEATGDDDEGKDDASATATASEEDGATADEDDGTVPSVLHSRPRAVRAVSIWASRLAAVPYSRWTVGASSALDHWIAREVLQMDEEAWRGVLSGGGTDVFLANDEDATVDGVEGGDTPGGLVARARDIQSVRGALFPETLMDDDEDDIALEGSGAGLDGAPSLSSDPTEKSIDELLRSLGEIDGEDDAGDEDWKFEDEDEKKAEDKEDEAALLESLVDELQMWRKKHQTSPYDSWDEDRRGEFDQWLEKYVTALSDEDDADKEVDMVATRNALLSRRPLDKQESEDFWSNVKDETQAEIYLQELRADAEKELEGLRENNGEGEGEGESTAARMARLETFLAAPYDAQLRRFADAGALRPLLDEYAKADDRSAFLERHSETFLEGLELEHLVSDPDGAVEWDDLGPDLRAELLDDVSSSGKGGENRKGRRFSVKKIPYGTDEYGTSRSARARDMYRLWNEHKSNRATYEEDMFRRGEMGLDEGERIKAAWGAREKEREKEKKNKERKEMELEKERARRAAARARSF